MKVQEHKIQNNEIIHIYINEDEENDIQVQERLNEMRTNNKVVVFVSGNKDPKQTLKAMVKAMKQETLTNL